MGKMKLDLIKRGNYITCFIDGNHENHYALETYPREKWRGGMVHVIRRDSSGNPKIVHLIRGEVYGINGKRIFVLEEHIRRIVNIEKHIGIGGLTENYLTGKKWHGG